MWGLLTFGLKMADSIAILVKAFLILILDQFSRGKKMCIEYAHLQQKVYSRNISSLKFITV